MGCYWVVWSAVWCCVALRSTVQCCVMLRDAAWCCVMLRDAAWCCVMLRGAAWRCVMLRGEMNFVKCYRVIMVVADVKKWQEDTSSTHTLWYHAVEGEENREKTLSPLTPLPHLPSRRLLFLLSLTYIIWTIKCKNNLHNKRKDKREKRKLWNPIIYCLLTSSPDFHSRLLGHWWANYKKSSHIHIQWPCPGSSQHFPWIPDLWPKGVLQDLWVLALPPSLVYICSISKKKNDEKKGKLVGGTIQIRIHTVYSTQERKSILARRRTHDDHMHGIGESESEGTSHQRYRTGRFA